jgi:hypothetical protein
MKTHSSPLALALSLALVASVTADEGMWIPSQIPDLAPKLRSMGFEGDPQAFADLTGQPMGAIVWLGNCSASFVSPEGLIVTNHHCATSALQYNSTPERNLLQDGFLATTRDEELYNGPGAEVWVTVGFAEVTDEIINGIDPDLSDLERYELLQRRVNERTAACEAGGRRCLVKPFFEGLRYYELAQVEIPDVRLVYAPARGVGNFGGETDNWRWPRHTGDWSFFRAYVGPDGRPAAHSKENVPYRPERWLKVQPAGLDEGDLVFVAGYPGTTSRLHTYEEVKETATFTYPAEIERYAEQIEILEALGAGDEEVQIKAASLLRGLNNSLTNRRGMVEGLIDGGLLEKKKAEQEALVAWIEADPARQEAYAGVVGYLAAQGADEAGTRERDWLLEKALPPLKDRLRVSRASLVSAAHLALLVAEERKLDDLDREPYLQARDWPRILEAQERYQKILDVRIDRALLRWALERAAALPAGERLEGVDRLIGLTPGMAEADSGPAIEASLDRLYAETRMADEAFRLSLFDMSPAELAALDEPFLQLAAALNATWEIVHTAEQKKAGAASRVRPLYAKAMIDKADGLLAPDANSTLRVTFGQVRGVDGVRDGIYWKPFTTLKGIEQKDTGAGEFDAPERTLDAIRRLREGAQSPYVDPALGDVPVDFLSTVDTTGGNSGSAALNGRGELVGLLFDGTYDTIASDFLFDPVRTRSISVDVRYMLWTMTEADGASHLVEEMGVLAGSE